MAAMDWRIIEDGSLSIGEKTRGISYHPKLNTLLVVTEDSSLQVLDVNTGVILQKSTLCADPGSSVECKYLNEVEQVLFKSDCVVGLRKDISGVLLLDSALQAPVSKTDDFVVVELTHSEAIQLLACLKKVALPGQEYLEEVRDGLQMGIMTCKGAVDHSNHKVAKWATVKINLPHTAISSVCSSLIAVPQNTNKPGLSIASAILDRLDSLYPTNHIPDFTPVSSTRTVDRALMYTEAARRKTFTAWPHMDYKWALPDAMAQAGFYHGPTAPGDDRALCFTCSVCLVCWEPTDEPWSEHERHSPNCPHVRGEHTQNVPLAATLASGPAQIHGSKTNHICCISSSTSKHHIATATTNGNICLWNVTRQLKMCSQFTVTLSNGKCKANSRKSMAKAKEAFTQDCTQSSVKEKQLEEASDQKKDSVEKDEGYGTINDLSLTWSNTPPSADDICETLQVTAMHIIDSENELNIEETATNGEESNSVKGCQKDKNFCHIFVGIHASLPEISKELISEENSLSNRTILSVYTTSEKRIEEKKAVKATKSKTSPLESGAGKTGGVSTLSEILIPQVISFDDKQLKYVESPLSIPPVEAVEPVDEPSQDSAMKDDFQCITQTKCNFSIKLPPHIEDENLFVSSMFSSLDPNSIVVVLSPVNCLPVSKKIDETTKCNIRVKIDQDVSKVNGLAKNHTDKDPPSNFDNVDVNGELCEKISSDDTFENVTYVTADEVNLGQSTKNENLYGGYILVYTICFDKLGMIENLLLQKCFRIEDPSRSLSNIVLLPGESNGDKTDDTVDASNLYNPDVMKKTATKSIGEDEIDGSVAAENLGQFAALTKEGGVIFMDIGTCDTLAYLPPLPIDAGSADKKNIDKFAALAYCMGMERVSVCTESGELRFLQLVEGSASDQSPTDDLDCDVNLSNMMLADQDAVFMQSPECLVNQPITAENLKQLTELTKFETLIPRFSATVPPCWTEIQQEQQQRRHPQHLHQRHHGDATQHTRTWKLSTTGANEHLFELVLSKPSVVGHIDVKLNFQHFCDRVPGIQITLLKQTSQHGFSKEPTPVDSLIDFSMDMLFSDTKERKYQENVASSMNMLLGDVEEGAEEKMKSVFLESHKNDIICGPLSLDSVIDVPGCSGLVTLTSHELLQSKYRSFLLHICTSESVKPEVKRCNRSNRKDPPFILTMFQNPPPVTPSEHISAFAFTKDLDKIQGVDWIQEISVTIRKTKRITVLNDRVQRLAMLESSSFHENIVSILIDSKSSGLCGSREFTRSLALDILCWVAGVQVSEPNRTSSSIVDAVRKEMSNIIRVCFLESGRSVAHRCSQLFMLCIGCTKNRGDQLMAEFHDIMLQGLLQWVPRILNAASAGSLHWFFLLLNLVKSGDLESTSETCASFLNVVSKQLQEKTLPQHALLRAKYGLYGTPLDAVMFDGPAIFLPAKSSTTPSTNSIQQSMNTFAPTLPTTTPHFQQSMVGDGKILAGENGKGNGNGNGELVPAPGGVMMKGILEVEPLHFVCCATSDGTQVKKTGIEGTPVPSLHAGGMNAKESGGSGPVSTLSALSNAMTEHQLQKQKLYPFGLPHMDYPSQSKASSLSYTLQPYVAGPSLYLSPGKSFAQAISQGPAGKNGISSGTSKSPAVGGQNTKSASTVCVQSLIQPPQPHLLVIDRMHSGARRYVTLDFGRPILLTDVFIPSCTELASLSIDLWSQGEEVDGQRLVVSMDISKRDLTMNDLLPPPLCRYVKITVIGRYGRNTVRTKIPIGCFYGHSFVFPWEQEQHVASLLSSAVSSADDSVSAEQYTQSVAMLREDIHCRYRLACDRLEHLLDAAHSTYQSLGQASKKDEKNGMSTKMRKAYMECIQLQNQLNLVQRVVNRLKQVEDDDSQFEMLNKESSIKAASGDQLRVVAEYLVVCLISITSLNPSPPAALLHIMSMESCKALFKDLIMCGTPRVRVTTGALLQRVCQSQAWWGEFLATTLEELFHSEQAEVFPQERVFVLLTLMGHKSIMSGNMGVLEHFLALLGKMLSPLQNTQGYYRSCRGNLDLPLVGWVLLFLSRTLEQATPPAADVPTEEDENGNDVAAAKEAEKKTKRKAGSRWDFINLDLTTTEVPKTQRGTTNQAQCQRLAKQMKMHKEQIKQLESKHKAIQTMLVEEGKDKDPLVLQKVFKEYKQHKSKHSKDLLRIRRLAYQELHSKGEKDSKGDDDASEKPADIFQAQIRLPREQCLPVVQGLTQLLLSMDFTCHVDLFLVACKVLARICNSTRPAITLAEVMTQQQLQQLLMLCVGSKFNCGAASWGGPWASHAIICLLQDILEGELLHPIEEASNQGTHGEERLEIDPDLTNDAAPEIEVAGATGGAEVNGVAGNVFDIMGDTAEASDFPPLSSTPDESIMVHPMQQPSFLSDPLDIGYALPDDIDDICFGSSKYYSLWEDGYNAKGPKRTLKAGASSGRILYQSMNGNGNGKGSASGTLQNVSLAMDARLELGLQMQAEWYLKISSLTDVSAVSQAQVTDSLPSQSVQSSADSGNTADNNSIDTPLPLMSSTQMLTVCFNQLFGEIQNQRVNLEALLQLWLTLNINATTVLEHKQESKKFNASLVPTIPLLQDSMSNLLACLARQPNTHLQTWCLTFQTLCCLANSRCHDPEETSEAVWMANLMVEDHNLLLALVQFFSGNILQPGDSTIQGQAGPSVVQAVKDFLVRLQMRVSTSPEPHTSTFKSLLLNLLQLMVVEPRGAFQVGTGPLDAQIFLLECILEQEFTTVDVANTVNLIDAIVLLVHSHLSSAQQVTSHSASTSTLSARSCFTGLFASMLRGVEYKSIDGGVGRDDLMCYLLRLVNNLVEIPIDTVEVPISESNIPDNHKSNHPDSENSDLEPMTDSSKINAAQQQLDAPQGASGSSFSAISDEEKQRTGESSEQPVNTTAISDEEKSSASTSSTAPTMTECTKYIADIILSQSRTVTLLLSALSYCDSNTMAMIIGGGLCQLTTESLSTGESVSVGDNIYQVLCTLNTKATVVDLILKNIMSYISGGDRGHMPTVAAPLSEPLLWFILRALSSEKALQSFHNMGGIQVFCRNLVSSNQTVIDTTPSAISSIMQRLGVANKPNGGAVPPSANIPKSRGLTSETETIDGLYNFAPHGSISSSSPTAQPAEVLLQPQAPHRRARSPAWSYHFYPDESWCDLTITLPGAVLIKEIHIQPHLTSLATCPSAVALELSRDGYTSIPISSPISTGGLTYIKLQLQKPEVTRSVCLKLHRPRDSSSIGLSQIMLLGLSAFSNSSANQNPFLLTEDAASKSSVGWLRLLHHCLTYSPSLEPMMSAAASTSTPHLLTTCTALLLSRHSLIRAANIEVVLLKIGLHSTELGLSLFDILLRNLYLTDDDGQTPSLLGRGHGNSSESTVEIIYQLGMTQDQGTKERVQALLEWLGDTARVALHKHSTYQRAPHTLSPLEVGLLAPSPAHIHCVATIIWSSFELPVPYDLRSLLTQELFSSIYEWSMVLPSTCALKKSADYVLCSMCYVQPSFFTSMMEWMGVVHDTSLEMVSHLTDDSKGAEKGAGTDDEQLPRHQPITIEDLGLVILNEDHLTTLSIACRSPSASQQLITSGFLAILTQALVEFCEYEILRSQSDSSSPSPRPAKSPRGTRLKHRTDSVSSDYVSLTADLVAPVLNFFGEVSQEPSMKEWLGGSEGRIFWKALLNLLCNNSSNEYQTQTLPSNRKKSTVLTSQQRSAIENATISFLSKTIAFHSENQRKLAEVICDVICSKNDSNGTNLITGFTRRLILQLMLEDEKILVHLKSTRHLYKASGSTPTGLQHPSFGAGHKFRTIEVDLMDSISKVLSQVSDTPSLTSKILDSKTEKLPTSTDKVLFPSLIADLAKSKLKKIAAKASDAGIKNKATDKYNSESDGKDSSSAFPRPPTRRGRLGLNRDSMSILTLSLHHSMFPNQALPSKLTLGQLMVLLKQRGLDAGFSHLHFTMKLTGKLIATHSAKMNSVDDSSSDNNKSPDDLNDAIPDAVLLDTPALPSFLHVFASMNGLALIAEHLPMLYSETPRPEIATSSSVIEKNADDQIKGEWLPSEMGGGMESGIEENWYHPLQFQYMEETNQGGSTTNNSLPLSSTTTHLGHNIAIPAHSLAAFGLFLRLPGYAEVLLKEHKKAQFLLRLILGVTDDGEGGHILSSPQASCLPTLPFSILITLLHGSPLTTDDGVLLRRMTLDIGALHLVLACMSILSHYAPRVTPPVATSEASSSVNGVGNAAGSENEKSQNYWAKGTGFGTGSTTSGWDVEQALNKQKVEEEHVTCLLQVLSAFINPSGQLESKEGACEGMTEDQLSAVFPPMFVKLLSHSCLLPAISSYLRNDSVLDMARHIPLYCAVLELLRAFSSCPNMVELLLPLPDQDDEVPTTTTCITSLLESLKGCVDTYTSKLQLNKDSKVPRKNIKDFAANSDDPETEGLTLLVPDIQNTVEIVRKATKKYRTSDNTDSANTSTSIPPLLASTPEERYCAIIKKLQFDTYQMVTEDENGKTRFNIPHHYSSSINLSGNVKNPKRARRLAQEAVTISTSLPLSASSSVFVRCDEERLDLMKVLITGPGDTPYANGCFEFDVYFPSDYPTSPMQINLETTGQHSIRFNPNLYNDGKVCLSILNTWHGRPEEKWNPNTSSFLQVLVSIQSLILVSEPYFNEPGYERSRGTPAGTQSSHDYDANIMQATVRWAMLEMVRNPPLVFKNVIQNHFYLKRAEVMAQCEEWVALLTRYCENKRVGKTMAHHLTAIKRHTAQLREELKKLKPPKNLEEFEKEDKTKPDQTVNKQEEKSTKEIEEETKLEEPEEEKHMTFDQSIYDIVESPYVTVENSFPSVLMEAFVNDEEPPFGFDEVDF